MGLEEARQSVDNYSSGKESLASDPASGDASASAASGQGSGNGDLAPDSAAAAPESSNIYDLSKAEKVLWDGKETPVEELRKQFLRQQDYTKKTQAIAEERRRFEEERRTFIQQQEETEKYNSNLDADIQNVLRDPSLEAKFREIYPQKYHAVLEKALNKEFGDVSSPNRSQTVLEKRLEAIERRAHQSDLERQQKLFENDVATNAAVLDSAINKLSAKYPHADEDSVLARAEHMATFIKKDQNFNDNFSQLMEKLYKENHQFHEKRYQQKYKQKVESQKQANTRGRDIGRGGATPATAPTKLKLKDVKNHILGQLDN